MATSGGEEEEEIVLQVLFLVSEEGTIQLQMQSVPRSNHRERAGMEGDSQAPTIQIPTDDVQLKHLQFVACSSKAMVQKAGRLYLTIRSHALPKSPSFNAVGWLERQLTEAVFTPLAAAGQHVLQSLDTRLDTLLNRLAPFSPSHHDAPKAWSQLPGVARLCRTLEPAARLSLTTLHTVHDHVVPSPYYKVAVDLTTGGLTYASTSTPYKLASHFIFPMVQPVADAALKSEAVNEAVHAVLEYSTQALQYWKPTSTGDAPTNKTPTQTPASNGPSTPEVLST